MAAVSAEAASAAEVPAAVSDKAINNQLISKAMKKSTIIILAVIVIVAIWGITGYNGMVKADEAVSTAWSNVENQYQRRADLIPNLVNTVKGYAAHEKETLDAVISARTRATQVTVDADNLTPEKLQEFQKAQGEVGSALGRLLAITEAYPELKANQNFLDICRLYPCQADHQPDRRRFQFHQQ